MAKNAKLRYPISKEMYVRSIFLWVHPKKVTCDSMYVSLKTTLNGSLKIQIIIEQKVTHRKELYVMSQSVKLETSKP